MALIEREQPVAPPARRRWPASPIAGLWRSGDRSAERRPLIPAWGMRAVAGAALVALLGWNVRLQQEVGQESMINDVVVADHQPSALKPRGGSASSAVARMFMGPSGSDIVLVIENLPPPPPGKVYQVWVANEHSRQPMNTFKGGKSIEQVVIHAPEPLYKYKWVMITLEDAGGSTTPSETMVLFGDL